MNKAKTVLEYIIRTQNKTLMRYHFIHFNSSQGKNITKDVGIQFNCVLYENTILYTLA